MDVEPASPATKRHKIDNALAPFIQNPLFLLDALRDLHRDEESIMFPNATGDIVYVLQATGDATDELMSFDLAMCYDETVDCHEKIRYILEHEYSAIQNEEDNYSMYMFTVKPEPSSAELLEIMDVLNRMHAMRICECFRYFVKAPDRDVCYMCTMRGHLSSDLPVDCVICNDPVQTSMGSMEMKACCQQVMHKRCVELWRRDDASKICPICRSQHGGQVVVLTAADAAAPETAPETGEAVDAAVDAAEADAEDTTEARY